MDQEQTLSDRALLKLLDSDEDVSFLTPEEKQRMVKLGLSVQTQEPLPNPDRGGPKSPSVMDERGFLDRAVDYLPAALSSVGGFAGGTKRTAPGMGLAALGAAGGEGLRQAIRAAQGRMDEVPDSPVGQLERMGTAAAVGAGTELGGRAVIGGLSRLAPKFMRIALGAQTPVRKGFPDVDLERAALDARAIPGSAASLARVQRAGEQGAASLRNDLKVADIASGNAPVATYDDAVSVLRRRVPDARMAARGGAPNELNAVKEGARKVSGMKSRPLNAEEAFVAKQAHQKAAAATYKAAAGAEGEAGAEVSGDLAAGIVAALKARQPEIAAKLLKQQESMALTRAMENAQPRTPLLRNVMAGVGGAGAGATVLGATGDPLSALAAAATVPTVTHLMTSPGSLARMGITSEAASRAMQSAGARLPDALVRKQLMELILGGNRQ